MSADRESFPDVTRHCRRLVEEVRPNIYRTTFVLKNFHYAPRLELYCVVEPGKRALFIDVGWSEISGSAILDVIVNHFNLKWENVDIFLTHFHWDHSGNLEHCLSRGAGLVHHGMDFPLRKADYDLFLRQTGALYRGEMGDAASAMRAMRGIPDVSSFDFKNVTLIGCEEIEIAGYRFRPILTPGHAPEHACLYEPEKKFLFAGDHIVEGVPLASQYRAGERVLARYLHGLHSIAALNLEDVYMSHCDPLHGPEVIRGEIMRHTAFFDRPLSKVATLVTNSPEPLCVYDLACRYYADGRRRIEELDALTRMRRISVQFLYLEYLYDTGAINRQISDEGVLLYGPIG